MNEAECLARQLRANLRRRELPQPHPERVPRERFSPPLHR